MEAISNWFNDVLVGYVLKDLLAMPWYLILTVVLLAVLGVALIRAGREKWSARVLASAALCIAVSYVLSCIRLFRMPLGGSVVPFSILPLVAFAVAYGTPKASVVTVAYGLLQLITGWIMHPVQAALDYVVAYWVLALGGLVVYTKIPEKFRLSAAIIFTGIIRWLVHILSAAVFFADSVPEGWNSAGYFMAYNAYIFPEVIMSAIVALLPPVRRVLALMKPEK